MACVHIREKLAVYNFASCVVAWTKQRLYVVLDLPPSRRCTE